MNQARSSDDAKSAVLDAALKRAPGEGFSEGMLAAAGKDAGVAAELVTHLFPQGPASLVELFSEKSDAAMERALAEKDLAVMKIRERISAAVLARIDAIRPHKEAGRRAAAFLLMPAHAPLGMKLLYATVDALWRAAGDTSTDFNFYTKRAILAGVYSSTLMRWFNDSSEDESPTHEFLAARIENVMQFEKFKTEMRERTKDMPSFADVLKGFSAPKT
ncbi:MAG TPA: COQ9 family protein [Rhizomicrobium sp.]|nr:COQ9 family protein [Rhizomicrobium sp.]